MSNSILDKKRELNPDGTEKRQILKTINGINVYVPTLEQDEKLMNFIEKHIDEKTKKVKITGEEVFRVLYKELTDLKDIDKVTDEELKEIINHPTQDLEEINQLIYTELNRISKKILYTQNNIINQVTSMFEAQKLNGDVELLMKNKDINIPKVIEKSLKDINKNNKNILQKR